MKEQIKAIEKFWENKNLLVNGTNEFQEVTKLVQKTLSQLEKNDISVCEKENGKWKINEWIKKAILLSFRTHEMKIFEGGSTLWYDKIPPQFSNEDEDKIKKSGVRVVPGAFIRSGSHIGKGVVIMPSFINIGANISEGSMIDTWSTVGSCAYIGKNCHISGGVGIGGVLEPLQANPVIIEDNCFIGARSEIVEGVIVEEGSVISMGVYIGLSTKIIDRETGEVHYGRIPAYSVVVPGSLPNKDPNKPNLYCAVIIKKVDQKVRNKTSINELLRS